jgi:hypothetical protein
MEITRSRVNLSYVNTGNLADGKPADITTTFNSVGVTPENKY